MQHMTRVTICRQGCVHLSPLKATTKLLQMSPIIVWVQAAHSTGDMIGGHHRPRLEDLKHEDDSDGYCQDVHIKIVRP